jgi:endonuclease III
MDRIEPAHGLLRIRRMTKRSQQEIVRVLLDEFGQTYAREAGIRIEEGTPEAQFQLLVLALLLGAPIPSGNAIRAAKALIEAELGTPEALARATQQERVDVLSESYKRLEERTATRLGETAEFILRAYSGDLGKLRQAANHDVEREHELLEEFNGIGPVGADIFLREVQGIWEEVYPFADDRVIEAARELGLPDEASGLSEMVERGEFPSLAAALVRVDLDGAYEQVRTSAGSR